MAEVMQSIVLRIQAGFARPGRPLWLGGLLGLLACASAYGLLAGAVTLEAPDIWQAVLSGLYADPSATGIQHAIIWEIRLPRLVLAALVGAVLAVSGAALQTLFRNPLADPGLIGVSGGAALAAGSVIVFGGIFASPLLLPMAAFGGALLAVLLVVQVGRSDGMTSVATVLLAGIALNAIAVAGIGLLSYLADDQALRDLTFWTLGSVGRAGWSEIGLALPMLLAALLLIPMHGNSLNALLLGEAEAGHLGVDVERLKRRMLLAVTMGVGAAVSLTGIIGFIGLIVPHVLRLWLGPDNARLLIAAPIGGAILLVLADTLARTWVAPAELPVGILTSLVGGPFFLWLIIRYRREMPG